MSQMNFETHTHSRTEQERATFISVTIYEVMETGDRELKEARTMHRGALGQSHKGKGAGTTAP